MELLAPTVMSMESLGKSSQSIPIQYITSHDQRARITATKAKRIVTYLNGSQFRQVYSVSWRRRNYSQARDEYNH